jgi:hypothetical protein
MRCYLPKFTFKKVQSSWRVLFCFKDEVIPELSYFLVKEANRSLRLSRHERTEDKIVSAHRLRLDS